VSVNSTPEDPVHIHITEVGTSGLLNVPYMPVGGTIDLSTSTLAALESISVRQEGTWTVSIGTNGQVVVSNFTSTVNIASLPAITGIVEISSLPAITGTVAVSVDDISVEVSVIAFVVEASGVEISVVKISVTVLDKG
jgi:hypothetical protein